MIINKRHTGLVVNNLSLSIKFMKVWGLKFGIDKLKKVILFQKL